MPAGSSENVRYSSLRKMTVENQPQLPETVPYSNKGKAQYVGEEHVTRRKFYYTIVLTSSQIS